MDASLDWDTIRAVAGAVPGLKDMTMKSFELVASVCHMVMVLVDYNLSIKALHEYAA